MVRIQTLPNGAENQLLSPYRSPFPTSRQGSLEQLAHIERDHLGADLHLDLGAVLDLAEAAHDAALSPNERMRLVALVAAQMNVRAQSWLNELVETCEPDFRPYVEAVRDESLDRFRALSRCIRMLEGTLSLTG